MPCHWLLPSRIVSDARKREKLQMSWLKLFVLSGAAFAAQSKDILAGVAGSARENRISSHTVLTLFRECEVTFYKSFNYFIQ
jgi:hypothetical protein